MSGPTKPLALATLARGVVTIDDDGQHVAVIQDPSTEESFSVVVPDLESGYDAIRRFAEAHGYSFAGYLFVQDGLKRPLDS